MTPAAHEADRAFLDAASRALRDPDGSDPLTALGWWELLTDLDDPEVRRAALALFRAQGRELADTAALGVLAAQPFHAATGVPPGSLVAAISRHSPRRGAQLIVLGDVTGKSLLIDRPGHGATVVAATDVTLRPVTVPGRLTVHEVDWRPGTAAPTVREDLAGPARARGTFLGRVALALEILGAAESSLTLAVEHACNREQFGKPIGTFQAVRHLLAWALTDCVALEHVAGAAVDVGTAAPAHYDETVKALAGRNGRRACERSLQVLGAIGFTREHSHHHFHSRVLALDSLLGTSADLVPALGARLRETGADPALPSAALLTEPES